MKRKAIKVLMTTILMTAYIGTVSLTWNGCASEPSNSSTSGSDDSSTATPMIDPSFKDDWAKELLISNYTPNTLAINIYQRGRLSAEYKQFGTGTVSAPETAPYTSFVEYTLKGNSTLPSHKTYSANFINFSAWTETQNTMYTKPMSTAMYEKYKDIDWTDAYMTFWLYNDTALTADIYGTDLDFDNSATPKEVETVPSNDAKEGVTESKGHKVGIVKSKTWTKLKVSLKTHCNITSDVIATGDYNVKLWFALKDESVTQENYDTAQWIFYMTGFEFVSGSDLA